MKSDFISPLVSTHRECVACNLRAVCHRASYAARWHNPVPRDEHASFFGFACGELEYTNSGVLVMRTVDIFEHLCMPLVLLSFCWPGIMPCLETTDLSTT